LFSLAYQDYVELFEYLYINMFLIILLLYSIKKQECMQGSAI